MKIRELTPLDRTWLAETLQAMWGLPVVSISGSHDPSTLPGFLAEDAGVALGAVTYRLAGGECEVVTLNAFEENRGIGTALLLRVKQVADEAGRRLWLITTNDNLRAIGFYQRRGMDMAALHRNFVEVVRAEKPGAGAAGHDGISFRHAIEFSF